MDIKKIDIKNIICKVSVSFTIIFSFCACAGIDLFRAAIASILCCFINYKTAKLDWKTYSLILVTLYLTKLGFLITVLSVTLALILLLIFKNKKEIFYKNDLFFNGLIISSSFLITAFFTNQYFGIGSYGDNFIELIQNYISLGFHPNWRGILYGTIVMVLMITIPRKFKNNSKYLFSGFIGLIVTLLLNYILVPNSENSPITEVSADYFGLEIPVIDFNSLLSSIVYIVVFSYALFILIINTFKDKLNFSNISLPLALTILSVPIISDENENNNCNSFNSLISAVIVAVLYIIFYLSSRLPISSCAVVIIVGGWQSINWKNLKNTFSSIQNIIKFIIIFTVSTLLNPAFGIICSFLLY